MLLQHLNRLTTTIGHGHRGRRNLIINIGIGRTIHTSSISRNQNKNNAKSSSSSSAAASPSSDLERLFIDERVQSLLRKLTGFDLEKIHKWRMLDRPGQRHYALMTDGMYKEFLSKLAKQAEHYLQFVPYKEPRPERAETLAVNPEIAGCDTYKLVFTDISFDANNRNRTVVVREPNGRLRTALPEEHFRMHRIYYEQPDRPVKEPPVFHLQHTADGKPMIGPVLEDLLERDEHEFVLDWACYYYEPDDPKFHELCKCIFDRTMEADKMEVLYATRHFGSLAFYMLTNGHIAKLLNFYAQKMSLSDAANTIRLHHIMYPDWKTTVTSDESDLRVVLEYLRTIYVEMKERSSSSGGSTATAAELSPPKTPQQPMEDELKPLRNFMRSLVQQEQQQQKQKKNRNSLAS